ncbi:MAG TPA: hypothetical protein PKC21_04505 [Oligoflexia bacterium]|nr:hypothetical protein [Oligoflexia bacterium]HMR24599.1 hypothetical protein [Oligoflexia bacterium]
MKKTILYIITLFLISCGPKQLKLPDKIFSISAQRYPGPFSMLDEIYYSIDFDLEHNQILLSGYRFERIDGGGFPGNQVNICEYSIEMQPQAKTTLNTLLPKIKYQIFKSNESFIACDPGSSNSLSFNGDLYIDNDLGCGGGGTVFVESDFVCDLYKTLIEASSELMNQCQNNLSGQDQAMFIQARSDFHKPNYCQ